MKQLALTTKLYEYMIDTSLREHPILKDLREVTAAMPLSIMQIVPDQAQFMQFLLRLIGAKYVLELGTFTGYSALAMALALPEDGRVITCDVNKNWTAIAQDFWQRAKQDHKITLRLAPALESLHALFNDGWSKKFDFIFIDADKTNYLQYYELALQLLSPRGVIVIDNVFWEGKVIDENDTGAQTREIRKLNALLKNDDRVFISLLPIADGLFLIQHK
jgi:predicted O-methyltransferase YrrM